MSTPSLAPARSPRPTLSVVPQRSSPPRSLPAIAVVVVVLALNTGTAQSNLPSPVNATPVKSITPAGANMEQGFGALSYRHSFAGHR